MKYKDDEERAISRRYSQLKHRVKKVYDLDNFWSRRDFIKWYKEHRQKEEKKCFYCECTEEELLGFYNKIHSDANGRIPSKRRTRGKSLEIERKADKEYTRENCILSCYWCNNAKSDVFSFDEFKPIGEAIGKAIKLNLQI